MDYLLLTDNLTKAIGILNDLTDSTNLCIKSAIITWKIDLPNVKKAQSMFQGSSIKNFKGDLSKCENTNQMFRACTQFYKFESKLPMLIDGSWMFHYYSKINHWDIELPNLVNGEQMFGWYSKLTYFHSETPKLEKRICYV